MTQIHAKFARPGVPVSYGCMRLPVQDSTACRQILEAAVETGFRCFDHADIYNAGASEQVFGELWDELGLTREELCITSKCGIRVAGSPQSAAPKRYDFSRQYILDSVTGSLQRLQTEYLDSFLLHRLDYLMDVDEVAEAFSKLKSSGQVRQFGVSNFSPSQVELLNSALDQPLAVNQVEVSLLKLDALHDGTLDQCQRLGMLPEAWSPLQGSFGEPRDPRRQRVQSELQRQAAHYDTETWVVALAWLLRHPAGMVPVIGTTHPDRISMAGAATEISMSREDWYCLLESSLGHEVA